VNTWYFPGGKIRFLFRLQVTENQQPPLQVPLTQDFPFAPAPGFAYGIRAIEMLDGIQQAHLSFSKPTIPDA
jgi:hypothetical protein